MGFKPKTLQAEDKKIIPALASVLLINSVDEKTKAEIDFSLLNKISKRVTKRIQLKGLLEKMSKNPPMSHKEFGKNIHDWIIESDISTQREIRDIYGKGVIPSLLIFQSS